MSDLAPEPFERQVSRERTAWKLFAWLVAGALVFSVLDYVGNRSGWVDSSSLRRLFNVGREDSLHNFVAAVQELAVAGVALVAYLHARRTERRSVRLEWGVALAIFLWIGIDDGAIIHERVGTAIEEGVAFFPSYAWQVIFVPVFTIGLAVAYHVLARTRRAPWTRLLFLAAFCCYVTATGLDYVEGRDGAFETVAEWLDISWSTVSHYSRVIEEFFEDVGASLFLVTLLRHLLWTVPAFRITVVRPPRPELEPELSAAPGPASAPADLPGDARYS